MNVEQSRAKRVARRGSKGETLATIVVGLLLLGCVGVVLLVPTTASPSNPGVVAADVSAVVQGDRVDRREAVAEETSGEVGSGLAAGSDLAAEAEAQASAQQLVCRTQLSDFSFVVLSYNIKSARAASLQRLADNIKRSGADAVLLQEVDNRRRSTGSVDQAAWLANSMGGWYSAFGQNVSFGDGKYGTAIISRFPILSSENHRLPNAGVQPRGLLHAVVDVKGVEVSLYSTHLTNVNAGLRASQARSVATIVSRDPRPRILGGDMNAWPTSQPTRILASALTDTWVVAGQGKGATHPARRPRTRIDYLLHGGPELSATSADVRYDGGSDHLGVRATYRLGGIADEECRVG